MNKDEPGRFELWRCYKVWAALMISMFICWLGFGWPKVKFTPTSRSSTSHSSILWKRCLKNALKELLFFKELQAACTEQAPLELAHLNTTNKPLYTRQLCVWDIKWGLCECNGVRKDVQLLIQEETHWMYSNGLFLQEATHDIIYNTGLAMGLFAPPAGTYLSLQH